MSVHLGKYKNRQELSFGAVVEKFLSTGKRARNEQTQTGYGISLRLYKAECDHQGLSPLTGDALIAFNEAQHKAMAAGEIAPDTVRTRLKAVSSLFSWMWRFDLTPLKPELVRKEFLELPPAKKLSPRDTLTIEEAERLLDETASNKEYVLIRLMLDAGLRVSEAVGLNSQDIFEADDHKFFIRVMGKGDKERMVPIPKDFYNDLAEYVQAKHGENLTRCTEPLFSMHRTTAWRIIKRRAGEAGITKDISPHSLRHTYANVLAKQGVPIEVVAQLLGHEDVATTAIYTRPAELARLHVPIMPWSSGLRYDD